ncbi:hypothetical protein [Viscerimonas tarda]
MKKIIFILTALFVLTTGMAGCDKEENTLPQNIRLYGKDSLTIQNYIQGKWICVYGIGGLAANYIHHHYDGYTFEFTADKRYIISGNGKTETYMYYWKKHAIYTGSPDSIYMMQPMEIFFDFIKNDTLIYHEDMSEPIWYYLTRANN